MKMVVRYAVNVQPPFGIYRWETSQMYVREKWWVYWQYFISS